MVHTVQDTPGSLHLPEDLLPPVPCPGEHDHPGPSQTLRSVTTGVRLHQTQPEPAEPSEPSPESSPEPSPEHPPEPAQPPAAPAKPCRPRVQRVVEWEDLSVPRHVPLTGEDSAQGRLAEGARERCEPEPGHAEAAGQPGGDEDDRPELRPGPAEPEGGGAGLQGLQGLQGPQGAQGLQGLQGGAAAGAGRGGGEQGGGEAEGAGRVPGGGQHQGESPDCRGHPQSRPARGTGRGGSQPRTEGSADAGPGQ